MGLNEDFRLNPDLYIKRLQIRNSVGLQLLGVRSEEEGQLLRKESTVNAATYGEMPAGV